MSKELVKASPVSVPATGDAASLPELVERAGGAARFAWDEFFYAEHHNPHTQKAYHAGGAAVPGLGRGAGGGAGRRSRRAWSGSTSSAWAARLPSGTSIWRRYAASSTGWSTGMSCILNPAASVQGRQGSGDRGQDAGNHHRAGPHAAGVGRIPAMCVGPA